MQILSIGCKGSNGWKIKHYEAQAKSVMLIKKTRVYPEFDSTGQSAICWFPASKLIILIISRFFIQASLLVKAAYAHSVRPSSYLATLRNRCSTFGMYGEEISVLSNRLYLESPQQVTITCFRCFVPLVLNQWPFRRAWLTSVKVYSKIRGFGKNVELTLHACSAITRNT